MRDTPEMREELNASVRGKRHVAIFTVNREYRGMVFCVWADEVVLHNPVMVTDEGRYSMGIEEFVISLHHVEGVGIIGDPA